MKSLSSQLNGSNVYEANGFERLVAEHKYSFQTPRLFSELFKAHRSSKTLSVLAEKAHKPSREAEILRSATMAFNRGHAALGKTIL